MPQTIDNMSVTWTNSLTTYTGIKLNAAGSSDANSAAGSLLMDLQVGGASKVKVGKNGGLALGGGSLNTNEFNTTTSGGLRFGSGIHGLFPLGSTELHVIAAGTTTIISSATTTRINAGKFVLGAADAATAVPQTLSVQSVATGNSNVAGANFTIAGSQGTGGSAGGAIILQVAPNGNSGSNQNALENMFTISPIGHSGGSYNTNANYTFRFPTWGSCVVNYTSIGGTLGTVFSQNGTPVFNFGFTSGANTHLILGNATSFGFTSGDLVSGTATADTILRRDAPGNILALRNGGTSGTPVPQQFRVYNWFDGTNGEYGKMHWFSDGLYIGTDKAGTGANRTIYIQTGGTNRWTFDASGGFFAAADNAYDIGASSSGRPRHVYAGTTLRVSGVTLSPLGGVNRLAYGSSNSTSDIYAFFNPDDTLPNLRLRSTWGFGWSSNASNPVDNPFDTVLTRVGAGIVGVRASSSTTGAALSFVEQTAPAAPATDGIYIYAEDNGSGKTRLMARFATGAAVQIAIEP